MSSSAVGGGSLFLVPVEHSQTLLSNNPIDSHGSTAASQHFVCWRGILSHVLATRGLLLELLAFTVWVLISNFAFTQWGL